MSPAAAGTSLCNCRVPVLALMSKESRLVCGSRRHEPVILYKRYLSRSISRVAPTVAVLSLRAIPSACSGSARRYDTW